VKRNLCGKYGDVFICEAEDRTYVPVRPSSLFEDNHSTSQEDCMYYKKGTPLYNECYNLVNGIKCNSKRARKDASIVAMIEAL